MQAIDNAELIGIVRDHESLRVTEADLVAELAGVSLVDKLHDLAATNGLFRDSRKDLKKKAAQLFLVQYLVRSGA